MEKQNFKFLPEEIPSPLVFDSQSGQSHIHHQSLTLQDSSDRSTYGNYMLKSHIENRKIKFLLAVSLIALSIGIIHVVVASYFKASSDVKQIVPTLKITTETENFIAHKKVETLRPYPQKVGDEITELEISSLREFDKMKGSITSIIIKTWKLTETEYNLKQSNSSITGSNGRVRSLEVLGSLPEYILIYLLRQFKNLERLRLNIDEMCHGAEEQNRSILPAVKLPALKFLSIEESRICPLITWVLRWKMPKLEKFHIFQTDISERMYKVMKGFLGRTKDSLREIYIDTCYICPECHFDQLSFLDNVTLKISHKQNSYLHWE